ncbi:IclR family transcriptional regulator [Thermoactinospora rubra]|uniref:IclR family transcriptional regulator n=1 Tax=Thermoactinospora rubra TaxID=1088767 RepID=UPI000A11B5B2|nr:IclR family transcriptional regulator [Thermoactinospora rubra]
MTGTSGDRPAGGGTILEKGLAMLEAVARAGTATPALLAGELGLSRSATYRLVDRLRTAGFLEDAPGGGLRLGLRAVAIGASALRGSDIVRLAPEHLHQLADLVGETVNLAVPDGDEMVYILQQEGPGALKVTARLGTRRPMTCTALGKAYLAALTDDVLAERLPALRYARLTDRSPADAATLREHISLVREQGYAVDDREVEPGVGCLAAAVCDVHGAPVAAVSVAGPADRVLANEPAIAPLVMKAAREISKRLGNL